jgi:recombination protein RecA
VVKNKVAPPFREAEIAMIYGRGFSASRDLLAKAVAVGLVEESGSWYSYGGERLGHGFDAAHMTLESDPGRMATLNRAVRDIVFRTATPAPVEVLEEVGDDEQPEQLADA